MSPYQNAMLILLSAVYVFGSASGAQDPIRMVKTTLRVAGRVETTLPADIDGDGQKEILVFWRQGHPPKTQNRVSVFRSNNGTIQPGPSQVLKLNKKVVAFDVGDVASLNDNGLTHLPDNRADLLLLTANGILVHTGLGQGSFSTKPAQLIKLMTVAAFPHREIIPHLTMLINLSGRYNQGLLVPSVPIGPLALYVRDKQSGWVFSQALRVPSLMSMYTAASDFRSMINFGAQFRITYPRWVVTDQNGDDRSDLLFFSKDEVAVFRAREDGSFPALPDLHKCFGLIRPKEHTQRGMIVRGDSGDINGDKKADLFFYKTTGGISNMKSELRVYIADKNGQYPRLPAWSSRSEGWGGSVRFADVNGDQKADMIRPHVDMGISNIIGVMLKGKIDVSYEIYLASEAGRLAKKPNLTIESTLGIDFKSAQELQGPYPVLDIDFTGDGVHDLLNGEMDGGSGKNPDRLEIRPGIRPYGYEDDPVWHVDLPATHFIKPYLPSATSLPGLMVYFPKVTSHQGDVWIFNNQASGS